MTFRDRALITLLLSSAWSLAAAAAVQDEVQDRERSVDQIFSAYDRPDSPGCALGIVRDGKFIYERAYGAASLELGAGLTPGSVFYMASVSKQFTAASAVLAAEQGSLSLDDDVRKYIPELPSYGHKITLRQMLHHTSGYRDFLTLLRLAGGHFEDVHTDAEMLHLISRQKALNYAPGAEYLYSNTNYFLMGVVIQRATGKSLAEFAAENIFKPLGMSHTRFYDDRTRVVPGRVMAYQPLAGGGFGLDWVDNFDLVGDGGLVSSVEDLLLWDRNFYANKLGKGTLLRELQTPGVLNNGKRIGYALGLTIGAYRGLPTVEHGGGMFGFHTELLRFPQQKFSVICLCNLASTNSRAVANRVADIYLAEQEQPIPAAVKLDPQPFSGPYRNATTHSVLEVSVAEGDVSAGGEHFKALSPSEFGAVSGDQLTFEVKPGQPGTVILSAPDTAPLRFEKFEPITPSATDLTQYVGAYATGELPAAYRFAVKEGHLTLAVNWLVPTVLRPTSRDEFQDPSLGASIVFHRNAAGHVDGFELFTRQVRHLTFAKEVASQH
jgi:CubicO group peptidase (beta-lactamase class C family)